MALHEGTLVERVLDLPGRRYMQVFWRFGTRPIFDAYISHSTQPSFPRRRESSRTGQALAPHPHLNPSIAPRAAFPAGRAYGFVVPVTDMALYR